MKSNKLTPAEINMRIKRQKQLLKERHEEYKIFGATYEDRRKDASINLEIKMLEAQLKESDEQVK